MMTYVSELWISRHSHFSNTFNTLSRQITTFAEKRWLSNWTTDENIKQNPIEYGNGQFISNDYTHSLLDFCNKFSKENNIHYHRLADSVETLIFHFIDMDIVDIDKGPHTDVWILRKWVHIQFEKRANENIKRQFVELHLILSGHISPT